MKLKYENYTEKLDLVIELSDSLQALVRRAFYLVQIWFVRYIYLRIALFLSLLMIHAKF